MKIFVSYASDQQSIAEALATELRNAGHRVFFDRHDLPPGETFTQKIRQSIEQTDVFVFLISPQSVTPGRYSMSELQVMQEVFPSPTGRVLPVMVQPTPLASVPDYLRNVTILSPAGDLVTDVFNAVSGLEARSRKRRHTRVAMISSAVAGTAAVLAALAFAPPSTQSVVAPKNPFSVYGTNFVGWGQTAVVNVTNSRPDYHKDYTCKVEAGGMAVNVQSIDHDKKCETITIKAKPGPFVESLENPKKPIEQTEYDRAPLAIDLMGAHGDVIWRGNWQIGFQNFVDPKRFTLRKLGDDLKPVNVALTDGPARNYLFELLLDKKPLDDGFECRAPGNPIVMRSNSCIFQVTGSLAHEEYILSNLTIVHPKTGWQQDYQIDTYER